MSEITPPGTFSYLSCAFLCLHRRDVSEFNEVFPFLLLFSPFLLLTYYTYFLYRIMQPQTLLDGVWHRELREHLQHTISTACALHFPECLVTLLVGGNILFMEEDLLQVNNWWLFELKNNQATTFYHLLMRGALLRLADLQESNGVFWCPSHKDSESTAARQEWDNCNEPRQQMML